MCGVPAKKFEDKARLKTQARLRKTLALPVALYGSETWTSTKSKEQRFQTSEMKLFIRIKGLYERVKHKTRNHTNRAGRGATARESAAIESELGRAPDQNGCKPHTKNITSLQTLDAGKYRLSI